MHISLQLVLYKFNIIFGDVETLALKQHSCCLGLAVAGGRAEEGTGGEERRGEES